MATKDRLSGNEAVAFALKQINPDVFPAFPITPSTEIPQNFATYVSNGEVDTEFITVESEHSSMSAAIAASAAGARALTATSSCGLAYMFEPLYIASSDRLPLLLAVVNRALTGPININCDHSDSMGVRESGWIQLYAENNQEAYDNLVQAYRISENPAVRLPIMVCQDGFITSHAVQNIELLEDEAVKNFVGEYEPEHYLLNRDEVMAIGSYGVSDYYMEAKRAQAEAMLNVPSVVLEVGKDFEAISGRSYGFFEEYKMEDADRAVVVIGSAAGTGKDAVDMLRESGEKVGLIKVRMYRPFPAEALAGALKGVKAVAVLDRAESYTNCGGPLGADVMAALFRARSQALAVNYIYGLGGRDITVKDFAKVYEDLAEVVRNDSAGDTYRYLGVRE
ncbi:MAG: pyruvate ferredoxin oxidoreductase [Clostridiales bacterium]|nr:pyruvate ferredoxin oxidoreductase [Candidatus Crickella merdequi]